MPLPKPGEPRSTSLGASFISLSSPRRLPPTPRRLASQIDRAEKHRRKKGPQYISRRNQNTESQKCSHRKASNCHYCEKSLADPTAKKIPTSQPPYKKSQWQKSTSHVMRQEHKSRHKHLTNAPAVHIRDVRELETESNSSWVPSIIMSSTDGQKDKGVLECWPVESEYVISARLKNIQKKFAKADQYDSLTPGFPWRHCTYQTYKTDYNSPKVPPRLISRSKCRSVPLAGSSNFISGTRKGSLLTSCHGSHHRPPSMRRSLKVTQGSFLGSSDRTFELSAGVLERLQFDRAMIMRSSLPIPEMKQMRLPIYKHKEERPAAHCIPIRAESPAEKPAISSMPQLKLE